MTSARVHRPIVAAALALGVTWGVSGCGGRDTRPCNDCPQVAGSWALSFEGGGAACGEPLPAGPLELGQVGSALSGTLGGASLRGTLYDTWDFNLAGSGAADGGTPAQLQLTGRYVPAQPAIDAGERLDGTFTRSGGAGDAGCILTRHYTGRRQ